MVLLVVVVVLVVLVVVADVVVVVCVAVVLLLVVVVVFEEWPSKFKLLVSPLTAYTVSVTVFRIPSYPILEYGHISNFRHEVVLCLFVCLYVMCMYCSGPASLLEAQAPCQGPGLPRRGPASL